MYAFLSLICEIMLMRTFYHCFLIYIVCIWESPLHYWPWLKAINFMLKKDLAQLYSIVVCVCVCVCFQVQCGITSYGKWSLIITHVIFFPLRQQRNCLKNKESINKHFPTLNKKCTPKDIEYRGAPTFATPQHCISGQFCDVAKVNFIHKKI